MIDPVSSNASMALALLKSAQDQTTTKSAPDAPAAADIAAGTGKSLSGNTLFAILSAAMVRDQNTAAQAHQAQATAGNSAVTASAQTAQASVAEGAAAMASDPYLVKDYTPEQALANWMAVIKSIGGPATLAFYDSTQSASFIKAFNSGALKVSDPNSIQGLDYTGGVTYFRAPTGEINGNTDTMHYNDDAYERYLSNNPNTLLSDSSGEHSWGGLLISW